VLQKNIIDKKNTPDFILSPILKIFGNIKFDASDYTYKRFFALRLHATAVKMLAPTADPMGKFMLRRCWGKCKLKFRN